MGLMRERGWALSVTGPDGDHRMFGPMGHARAVRLTFHKGLRGYRVIPIALHDPRFLETLAQDMQDLRRVVEARDD